MKDYYIRGTAADGQIRVFGATTKHLTEYARQAHNTSPIATAALGRLLTAGVMMGSTMKNEEDLLTIKVDAQGPIGGLTVTADYKGHVKGFVNHPEVMLPPSPLGKLDVGGAVQGGVLHVIKDLGMKYPYVGETMLVSGEIAEDLTEYYAVSEQTPSAVALGVLMNPDNTVSQAGGIIVQLMPEATEEVISALEERIGKMAPITTQLEQGETPESILEHLLEGMDLSILDREEASFRCNCSKERMHKALLSISREDLTEMIEDGETIEMNCHFCNTHYYFTPGELEAIRQERDEVQAARRAEGTETAEEQ